MMSVNRTAQITLLMQICRRGSLAARLKKLFAEFGLSRSLPHQVRRVPRPWAILYPQ